ncbi:MAG: hypothetical protein ACI82F_003022, partial [Planctomycetota bacterium]
MHASLRHSPPPNLLRSWPRVDCPYVTRRNRTMSIHRFLSPRAELLFEMEPVKGSRFHATLAPVSSAEEAMELVARVSAT